MKTIKQFSNLELVGSLKTLAGREREIGIQILWHLREVEIRRIHLDDGYPSLFEYCIKFLKYSSGAAVRRIAAMRLLKDLPQLETRISSGDLNLSQLAQAQNYFKTQQKNGRELDLVMKQEMVSSLEGKSSRDCEKYFAGLDPAPITREKERVLTDELTEIRFVASNELMEKLKRLKDLYSHPKSGLGLADLIEKLADVALESKDPTRKSSAKTAKDNEVSTGIGIAAALRPASDQNQKRSRYLPADLKTFVFQRDQGRCTYISTATGKKCDSTYRVQIDHVIPYSKGGSNEHGNLRLLCQAHNLRSWERHW